MKTTVLFIMVLGVFASACPRAGLDAHRPCEAQQDCESWQHCEDAVCTPEIRHEDASSQDAEQQDVLGPEDAAAADSAHIADASSVDLQVPDSARSDVSRPDTSQPDTYHPDAALPDTYHPDTALPDTYHPDTAQPDTYVPPSMCDNYPATNGLIAPGNPIRNYSYHDKNGNVHQLCELAATGKKLLYIVGSGFT